MLLVALFDGERVNATKHSIESWAALKDSKERERLVMPLCGIRPSRRAGAPTPGSLPITAWPNATSSMAARQTSTWR